MSVIDYSNMMLNPSVSAHFTSTSIKISISRFEFKQDQIDRDTTIFHYILCIVFILQNNNIPFPYIYDK